MVLKSQRIGTGHPFPSLIDNIVFYIPECSLECSLNLLVLSRLKWSIDCLITFTKDTVILKDWSSRQTIGVRCESNSLYQLSCSDGLSRSF